MPWRNPNHKVKSLNFINLLRNKTSTLERKLIEKNATTDFFLKERSKLVSYKKENQKVIINADQENEE